MGVAEQSGWDGGGAGGCGGVCDCGRYGCGEGCCGWEGGVMGVEVEVRMEDVVGWARLGYGLVCWC